MNCTNKEEINEIITKIERQMIDLLYDLTCVDANTPKERRDIEIKLLFLSQSKSSLDLFIEIQ